MQHNDILGASSPEEQTTNLVKSMMTEVTRRPMNVRTQSQDEAAQGLEQRDARMASRSNVGCPHRNVDVRVRSAAAIAAAALPAGEVPKVGRNQACPCGSGNKGKNRDGRQA